MEAKSALKGLDATYPGTFYRLREVFEEQVFELLLDETTNTYYVAYMMNDAIESFLYFENTEFSGKYDEEVEGITVADISKDANRNKYLLRIWQGDRGEGLAENTLLVWFSDIRLECHTYRYHNIGHYWVDNEEYLRQLNYRIGLIADKYHAFGHLYCNREELELLPLYTFGPLQSYVYVEWDKRKTYPSAKVGIQVFLKLAREAKDEKMVQLAEKYLKSPSEYRRRAIAKAMCRQEHRAVYDIIVKKITEASLPYEIRKFGSKQDELIRKCRQYVYEEYGGLWMKYHIEVLEEQPFTIWTEPFELTFYFNKWIVEHKKMQQERFAVLLRDTGDIERDYNDFVAQVEIVHSQWCKD